MKRTGRFMLGGLLGLALGYALVVMLVPMPGARRLQQRRPKREEQAQRQKEPVA